MSTSDPATLDERSTRSNQASRSPSADPAMVRDANDVPESADAGRGPAWLRERWPATLVAAATNIGLFLILFQAYKMVRKQFIQQSNEEAFENAAQIIRWEKATGLYFELDLQRWAIDTELIIRGLNWYYAAFMWVFYGCCVVAIVFAPARYRPLRRVFLCSMLLALPWYAIYPLAPPRLLHEAPTDMLIRNSGFIDTLAVYGPNYFKEGGLVTANRFAAMPSMHIGWSTIGAAMLWAAVPRWKGFAWGPALGIFHVSMMTLTVMATGNHFFLDAVGGWIIVLAAFALARAIPGWRNPLRVRRGFAPGAASIRRL